MIGAVVLAAGSSRRLGRPKQLEPLHGRTLLRNAVDAVLGAGCEPVIVVVGAAAEGATREVARLPVEVEYNASWHEGMASSIRCGVSLLAGRCDVEATVLTPCDLPALDAPVIRRLIDAYRAHRDGGICAVGCAYAGTVGSPALFAAELFSSLLELSGDRGAKALLLARPERTLRVPWPDGARDCDEPGGP